MQRMARRSVSILVRLLPAGAMDGRQKRRSSVEGGRACACAASRARWRPLPPPARRPGARSAGRRRGGLCGAAGCGHRLRGLRARSQGHEPEESEEEEAGDVGIRRPTQSPAPEGRFSARAEEARRGGDWAMARGWLVGSSAGRAAHPGLSFYSDRRCEVDPVRLRRGVKLTEPRE